jgi:hypothetical protein
MEPIDEFVLEKGAAIAGEGPGQSGPLLKSGT